MSFPTVRMRRLRRTDVLRDMLNQVNLQPSNLIYPIFVEERIKKPIAIESMPGYSKLPVAQVVAEGRQALEKGVKSVLLFGIPSKKDETGT
ncbi:MAG TPA: porphobilinogen synthase, partial [Candidatus Binatia bacterium]|nr:porphobilinogen synthase [Candidatus Binatia bacterium]